MNPKHPDHDPHEAMQKRAYDIWEREGRPHGRDADHWSRAEQELRNRMGEDRQDTGDHQPELDRTAPPEKPKRKPAARKPAGKEPGAGKAADSKAPLP